MRDDPEEAAEEIMENIDAHRLSSSDVPKSATREFWEHIIGELQTRLDALGDG